MVRIFKYKASKLHRAQITDFSFLYLCRDQNFKIKNMEPIKVNFKDCDRIFLDDTFKLKQFRNLALLDIWQKSKENCIINEHEDYLLKAIQEMLIDRVDDWNEQELIENFIGPMFSLINFNTLKYGLFSERLLKAIIDDYELSGYPDAIVAKGRRKPEIPYFCFHEYKKENDTKDDPAGQCLVAMLVAQELNHNEIPLYGVYVVGKHWYFMVLQGKEYAISKSYQAIDEDIYDIVKLLKHLKIIIEEYVKQ